MSAVVLEKIQETFGPQAVVIDHLGCGKSTLLRIIKGLASPS